MVERLTFEFPTPKDAAYFAERLYEFAPKVSHRVVDLLVPDDEDRELVRIARDYAVLTAYRMGATAEAARGTAPERSEPLYLLTIGVAAHDQETNVTTLAEFLAANPDEMRNASSWSLAPGAVTHGGGGASPRWRLARTAYVGRKA